MRNTKDIADAVFRIRDEYLEQKKRKRIRIEKACAAVSALAAAGIITAGAVYHNSSDTTSLMDHEDIQVISEVTEPVSMSITTAGLTANTESTHTSVSKKTVSTAVNAVSEIKNTASAISSTAAKTASDTKINVSNTAAVTTTVNTTAVLDTADTQPTVTTDINVNDYEEVIRMKAETVKRYLAALSAGAMLSGATQLPASAEPLYTVRPISPEADYVLYIENNSANLDFDNNGKFDAFDAYALFTYVNEPASLPDGYAARCEAYGDITADGNIDSADSDLLKEYCFLKFSSQVFFKFAGNIQYTLPESTDYYVHIKRTVSPDAPADIKEKLMNEFVDESYTYGSDENKNSFIDFCFYNVKESDLYSTETEFKYNEATYKKFLAQVTADNYSFDVNDDGKTNVDDLYDIFIYDSASADEDDGIIKEGYFGQFNNVTEEINGQTVIHADKVNTLRKRLPLSEEFKQQLWDKCKPIYAYVNKFVEYKEDDVPLGSMTVFELISRYIISNTDLDIINTNNLYFTRIHGNLILCDHSVNEVFTGTLDYHIRKYLIKAGETDKNDTDTDTYDKLLAEKNYSLDEMGALYQQAKADFEKGLYFDMYDINQDGAVDFYDSYVFDLYASDYFKDIPTEFSILPADYRKHIEEKFDTDHDGKPGTTMDYFLLSCIAGTCPENHYYYLDIYYLELAEKKGIVDLSDIRPYIEQICSDKEKGDADLDGTVTAVDACEVLRYYSQISVDEDVTAVTEAKMECIADYNTDGAVDSIDASAILAAYAENSVQS